MTETTFIVKPDTIGWYNASDPTSLVNEGFDSAFNSLQASGSGKNQFYMLPSAIGVTYLNEIESINFWTKKSTSYAVDVGDWFLQIYTDASGSPPLNGWYESRLNAEPYLADHDNVSVGNWNNWSTVDSSDNTLKWGDSSPPANDFGPNKGDFATLKATAVYNGTGTYGEAVIKFFTFATGSAWANGFDGEIGPITINLTNGNSTKIIFGDPPPTATGAPVSSYVLSSVSKREFLLEN